MESEVILDDSTVINDNLYIGAGKANISGNLGSDTSVIAGESVLSGTFGEDVISVSLSTFSNGTFNEDVRIVGPEVVVTGTVNGDLFVVGGNVRITETAKLNGELVVIGGRVTFLGELKGKAKIVAGVVMIDGALLSRSTITTQRLSIGQNAVVDDTLFYFSPSQAKTDSGAIIKKPLKYNPVSRVSDSQIWERFIVNVSDFWLVLKFVTTLFIAFILVYIFKVFSQFVADQSRKSFLKMLLTGFLSFFLIPIFAVVCLVSLFALPVGIILIMIYGIMLILIPALSSIIVGMLLWNLTHKKDHHKKVNFQIATIGVIFLTFVQFVPFIGSLINLLLIFVSLGVTVYYLYSEIRGNKL